MNAKRGERLRSALAEANVGKGRGSRRIQDIVYGIGDVVPRKLVD